MSSIWANWFRSLKNPPPQPRLLSCAQYYHTTRNELVTAEYDRLGGTTNALRLNMRNDIARRLFLALPQAEQDEIERLRHERFDEEMTAWEKSFGEYEEMTPEQHAE